jgi:hypothetical protein
LTDQRPPRRRRLAFAVAALVVLGSAPLVVRQLRVLWLVHKLDDPEAEVRWVARRALLETESARRFRSLVIAGTARDLFKGLEDRGRLIVVERARRRAAIESEGRALWDADVVQVFGGGPCEPGFTVTFSLPVEVLDETYMDELRAFVVRKLAESAPQPNERVMIVVPRGGSTSFMASVDDETVDLIRRAWADAPGP